MQDILIDILNSLEGNVSGEKDWQKKLLNAGIQETELENFFLMLRKIVRMQYFVLQARPQGGFPLRVYSEEEQQYLSTEARGLLFQFEEMGLLPPELRELVVGQLLQIEVEPNAAQIRLLILLVLFHPPTLDDMLSHYETLADLKNAVMH